MLQRVRATVRASELVRRPRRRRPSRGFLAAAATLAAALVVVVAVPPFDGGRAEVRSEERWPSVAALGNTSLGDTSLDDTSLGVTSPEVVAEMAGLPLVELGSASGRVLEVSRGDVAFALVIDEHLDV